MWLLPEVGAWPSTQLPWHAKTSISFEDWAKIVILSCNVNIITTHQSWPISKWTVEQLTVWTENLTQWWPLSSAFRQMPTILGQIEKGYRTPNSKKLNLDESCHVPCWEQGWGEKPSFSPVANKLIIKSYWPSTLAMFSSKVLIGLGKGCVATT